MIPDTHTSPVGWGIRPVLLVVGGYQVTSYGVFVLIGLLAAIGLYYYNTHDRKAGSNGLYIAAAALVGGIIGAKLPIWIAYAPQIVASPNPAVLLSGRTIVGGIIGGVIAVYFTKKRLGIKEKLGNYLVPSLCIGILFGRIGCFLTGCCYGSATALPWGVDFGDGIGRHPTQLYEALFVMGLFIYAQATLDRYAPGELFKRFMIVYFGWRFFVEFIRASPVSALGLTYYQVAAVIVIFLYVWRVPSERGAERGRTGSRLPCRAVANGAGSSELLRRWLGYHAFCGLASEA
jgi:prolipoprotein diacylglyceryltransferase